MIYVASVASEMAVFCYLLGAWQTWQAGRLWIHKGPRTRVSGPGA